MQTFLPYQSFTESARVLDRLRLGKQRLESYQLLDICIKKKKNPEIKLAWENHPARLMWVDYELQLFDYLQAICNEWINRGYKDTILEKSKKNLLPWCCINCKDGVYPKWLGDEKFHSSHRAALLFKNYDHYKQFNWT